MREQVEQLVAAFEASLDDRSVTPERFQQLAAHIGPVHCELIRAAGYLEGCSNSDPIHFVGPGKKQTRADASTAQCPRTRTDDTVTPLTGSSTSESRQPLTPTNGSLRFLRRRRSDEFSPSPS
jgi:hypothetical protein